MRGACSEAYAPFLPPVAAYRMTYEVMKMNPTSDVTMSARLNCALSALYTPSPPAEKRVAPLRERNQPNGLMAFAEVNCVTFAREKESLTAAQISPNSPSVGDAGSASYSLR